MTGVRQVLRRILKRRRKPVSDSNSPPDFEYDPRLGIRRRKYEDYESYLRHQTAKLGRQETAIRESDVQYEDIVYARYRNLVDFHRKTIVCLGARLGGEVRAFKRLGAVAIGIDLEPGASNLHVLQGDFHAIQFPNACFDFVFTNALDHVFDIDALATEVDRVLSNDGRFLVELAKCPPGGYEVIDTEDTAPLIQRLERFFRIESQELIRNQTTYINWEGTCLCLAKTADIPHQR